MTSRLCPALAVLALLCAATSAPAQKASVYLFDRLEQPAYARAWAAMLAGERRLPTWLGNKAGGSPQQPGRAITLGNRDLELYDACQPHNCSDSRLVVMFSDRGAKAKGVLIEANSRPRFFGHPSAAEAAALLRPTP